MTVTQKVLAAIAVVLALFVGGGFLLPSTSHVERSLEIDSPACTVTALVDGFGRFQEFSPWAELDADMKVTRSGPLWGVGAKQDWTSENPDVGSGSQTISKVEGCTRVEATLVFDGQDPALATWTIEPIGPRSKVTWAVDVDFGMNIIGRYFGLGFDGMMGPDFERGLAKLKTLAESLPKTDFGTINPESFDAQAVPFAYVTVQTSNDPLSVAASVGGAWAQVAGWYASNGLAPAGFPATVTTAETGGQLTIDAGLPLAATPLVAPVGGINIGALPAGKAVRVVHTGSAGDLPVTRDRLRAWMAARKVEQGGPWWEVMESDPSGVAEAERRTVVAVIVR
jgi:effector-binding domain-containing protein